MANFDNDDPLADLLSDGSNDSFFDEPKVLAKRASLTKTPDKKIISDLFGLDDDKPTKSKKESDWLELGGAAEEKSKELPKMSMQAKPQKKISFDDDEDVSNLGFDKKREVKKDAAEIGPKRVESNKKSALMESLFGPPKQSPETLFDDILQTKPKVTKPALKSKLEENTVKTENLGYAPTEFSRERRRSKVQTGVHDPLGLFSSDITSKTEITAKPMRQNSGEGDAGSAETEILFAAKRQNLKTKSAPDIKDLPEWLGGGSPVKTHKSDTGISELDKPEQPKKSTINKQEELNLQPQGVPEIRNTAENPVVLESLIAQQKLATSHIEYQNTSIALQQQESQLLMTLQLKKYEENLAEMQRAQQQVLIKQEQQFNSLLERQFAKQQIMENNMRMQQERINSHIQLLIAQPPVSGKLTETKEQEQEGLDELRKTNAEENSRLYEEMISTLKQRQHEEIFLLNESYKKQIALLENSMDSVENRLKTEITSLSDQFSNTIGSVKKEHEEEIQKYKNKLQDISVLHANEIKQIRENHNRIVEEIKYEYSSMIENMKQIKQIENATMDNASTYTHKLDNNLEILDMNSKILTQIQEKVRQDYGVLSVAREESLKAKEEEIKMLRSTLEKAREATDLERAQLMTLVRSLEMKLVEHSQNAKEERWALQQASSVLAARSAAFEREIEFTRASFDREKGQLETLKLSMLAEQETLILKLTEEKLAASAEKARLDVAAQLNKNYDAQKGRAEIEAAIRVAKEAADLTDNEREKLHKQQSEIEIFKRNLQDKERKLELKANELREVQKSAESKIEYGERALFEAKALEAKYNARLRDIQGQLVSLMGREKKLAEEKIALSKERLALHNNLKQVKRCSLCAADNLKHDEFNGDGDVLAEQDFSPLMFTVTDPDILRLRYEISTDDGNDMKKLS